MLKPRTIAVTLAAVIGVFALLFALAPLFASFDARRIAAHRQPVFCWSRWFGAQAAFLDGGSELYRGLGYEIVAKHRIIEAHRFDAGIAVSFTLPCYRRFDSETFIERTE